MLEKDDINNALLQGDNERRGTLAITNGPYVETTINNEEPFGYDPRLLDVAPGTEIPTIDPRDLDKPPPQK